MRTLKKTLCLVLALVLCLGLASVAFAGNFDGYTDAAKVGSQYEEAVAVLMGTGIVTGMTATEIAPEGNFTREQAAKIITYMTLGGTLADVLSADEDPFDDVKANRWSAGYIAYCVEEGILAGYGDGNYGPTDALTGYQFAKMLLIAIGYGVSSDYAGQNWAISVAQDAFPAGLFEGDASAATNEPIQRQQAMLMAFNALNYTKSGKTSVYVVTLGDKVLYTGTDALTALVMQQANTGAALSLETVSTGSLGDTVYGLKKSSVTDYFGRVSTTYINKNNTKQVYATFEPTAVLNYVGGTTTGKIAAALGCTKTTDTVSLTVITDGVAAAAVDATKLSNTAVGAANSVVEVYKTGESTYDVIVINTYAKKLSKADVVAAKKATATSDAEAAYIVLESGLTFETDAFKAGEVVLYTKGHNGKAYVAQSVVKAAAVTGVISKYTAATITVGGNTYAMAPGFTTPSNPFTTEYVFYVDSNNVVYAYDEVAAAAVVYDGYFYVLGYQIAMSGKEGNLFEDAVATTAAVKAKVLTTAGEEKVVDLAVYTKTVGGVTKFYYQDLTGKETEITASAAYTTTGCNTWVAYTVAGTAYSIEAKADTLTLTADYSKATTIEGKLMTSSTVYTYINTADKKVTTSTGYQNIKIASGSELLVIYADAAKTVVKELYLVKATTDIAGTTATYAYAAAQGGYVADGIEWTFYIDGEVKVLAVASGVSIEAGKVYDLTISTKNVVTAASAGIGVAGEGVEVTFVDSTYFVAGSVFTYSTGCKIYNVTTGTPGTADTIEVGDYVVVAASDKDGATLVYIVD